ncbi:hypothetical protein OS493_020477 [Desmophyllum pertusum]|uniref:Ig-like domain-containing protein n=1 Tax=Desmophyllum pertusum TaxID=174260 RepID=A0A9W9ZBX5_9CNID|nr:hypothetical protein OS493_020477 [Desmophyllum pertusum]
MIAEVYLQQPVPWFYSRKILIVSKRHYVEMNFTMQNYVHYPSPCLDGIYLEVRDGDKQSANLLGIFCGSHVTGVVRSSAHNMWLKFSPYPGYKFGAFYSGKGINVTVAPSLDQVAKTQFVFYNGHSSSLWCPAQGAPAPYIVWRKNGTVVQNSTSVRYEMNSTEEKNEKYSCEVDRPDGLDKKEINLIVESKFFNNNC